MTPLLMKKIEPNDWDEWWKIWNAHSDVVKKAYRNHNNTVGLWRGLDLYTRLDIKTTYEAPHAPPSSVIDDLIGQIETSIPIILQKVRVIENLTEVPAHSDHAFFKDELRCFLWNNYTKPVWSFEHEGQTKELILPDDSNCWYYRDYPMKHASIYEPEHSKGVMAIYGIPKLAFEDFVQTSATHYNRFAWVV
jgi:hypothetical protein